jgi:hypothetical protein
MSNQIRLLAYVCQYIEEKNTIDLTLIEIENKTFEELKILHSILPTETIFSINIIKFVKYAGCYLNV